jgi:hypothetical protein
MRTFRHNPCEPLSVNGYQFKDDVRSAREADPAVKAFVFYSNVDFTPAETKELVAFANGLGFTHVDIYWRERLSSPSAKFPWATR